MKWFAMDTMKTAGELKKATGHAGAKRVIAKQAADIAVMSMLKK